MQDYIEKVGGSLSVSKHRHKWKCGLNKLNAYPSSESVLRIQYTHKTLRNDSFERKDKCKTVCCQWQFTVFQFTTSLLKKTHHHRDLSTTHRTAQILQLRYSQFHKNCVPTWHQREPLAWCHQTPRRLMTLSLSLLEAVSSASSLLFSVGRGASVCAPMQWLTADRNCIRV